MVLRSIRQLTKSLDAKTLARGGGMCSEKLDFSYLGIYDLWNEGLGMQSLLIFFLSSPHPI